MQLDERQLLRVAGLELGALSFSKALPVSLEGVRIEDAGTTIYDISGEPLFHRLPLVRRRTTVGYADVAVLDAFAEPLLAVHFDSRWSESSLLRSAKAALRRQNREARFDEARFVAYSFPKIAVQFLLKKQEVAMLELGSWAPIPQSKGDQPSEYGLQRFSLIQQERSEGSKKTADAFRKRMELWDAEPLRKLDAQLISSAAFQQLDLKIKLYDRRQIHYAPRADDHSICYELRGQQTGVWCVAASVEMILNFYRWRYDQPRIATELNLGTCDLPNGLPYGDEIKVVQALEKLSAKSLDADMTATPTWALFRDEIREHRPLISFVPGHSRTVAGYTESLLVLLGELPYRGLLVFDPWPPTDCDHPEAGGVITSWENFRTTTYRHAFRAHLKHV